MLGGTSSDTHTHIQNSERNNCHPLGATCSSTVTVNATSLPSWSVFRAGGLPQFKNTVAKQGKDNPLGISKRISVIKGQLVQEKPL